MRKLLALTLLAALASAANARPVTLTCIGQGAPAVVFVSDAGDSRSSWAKVAAGAAKTSRVCFYDPPSGAATATSATDELHAQLRHAGVKRPVVLVGALYATVYADRYWSDVAGLVLLDPAFDPRVEAKLAHPFGDMPMTVLTSSDPKEPARKAAADALAARSVRGVSEIVPNTHGQIPIERPQAVIDAIADVVGRARARREP